MNKGTAENKLNCQCIEFLFMRLWNKYRDNSQTNQSINRSITHRT